MVIDAATRQRRNLHRRHADLRIAAMVRKAQQRIGVGNVEIAADQSHADGRIQALQKNVPFNFSRSCLAQQRDPVGTGLIAGAGHLHHQLADHAHDALHVIGPHRRLGFGDQHIAIWQHEQPSRVRKPTCQRGDRRAAGALRCAPLAPPFRLREVHGWQPTAGRRADVGRGPVFVRGVLPWLRTRRRRHHGESTGLQE